MEHHCTFGTVTLNPDPRVYVGNPFIMGFGNAWGMLAVYVVFLEGGNVDPARVGRLVTICVRFLAGSSGLFPAWNVVQIYIVLP